MLDYNAAAISLSAQQWKIVEAAPASRQLVLGGAGTGKTHALIERIRYLVDSEDVAPGAEILVLSFTRSVVRELKARLRLAEGQVRFVRPVTFDAFATRLLRELPPNEAPSVWQDAGYDGRISIARHTIAAGGEATALVRAYRHVFVDEIQDLVSVRADLVMEILKHVTGFTVLGDPAQAIYEYQVRDDPGGTTSAQFLIDLIHAHRDLSTTVLDENFRCSHALANRIAQAGAILRDPRVDDCDARRPLIEILGSLDHVESFADLAVALRGTRERTAVLCRTNAECLRVSQLLFEDGVAHHLQQEAVEQVLPLWLGQLFLGEERTRWSETRLRSLIERRREAGLAFPEVDAILRYLADTVGNDTVDLAVLREHLGWGMAPEPPESAPPPVIVVSTVHRAKGLEFDRAFFGAPRDGVPEDSAEEFRVLYVALSRARDDVWSFKAPNVALWRKPDNADDRWVKSTWQEPWKTLGWEFRPGDVDHVRPPGAGIAKADVPALQDGLANRIGIGSPALLRLVHVRASEQPVPFYAVLVDGEVVGETNDNFGHALRRRLRSRNGGGFPLAMSNLFVTGVETVAGVSVEGEANGLGKSGLWLRPRIAGLAQIDWRAE
jgi:hypothetical protein